MTALPKDEVERATDDLVSQVARALAPHLPRPGAGDAVDAMTLAQVAIAACPQNGAGAIVREQADDEGLWFVAQTAPEAYLQHQLRRLHSAIEASPAAPTVTALPEDVRADVLKAASAARQTHRLVGRKPDDPWSCSCGGYYITTRVLVQQHVRCAELDAAALVAHRAALAAPPPVPLDREAAVEAITATLTEQFGCLYVIEDLGEITAVDARSTVEHVILPALAPLLGTETTGDRTALANLLDEALALRNTIYYADEIEPGPVESAANRLGAVLGDLRAALGIVSPGSAP